MKPGHNYRIVTNNPLVRDILGQWYEIDYSDITYREILVKVRDLIYAGHTLFTHPLSGSVKPNETPYKSILVSKVPGAYDMDGTELMSNAIIAFDKFKKLDHQYADYHLRDFQLIDYSLLCSALDVDAVAGLSKRNPS